MARTIRIATADGVMPVYDARPHAGPRGAVVVVQEAFGVNPHIEDVTRRFAEAGYHAVAPHLFYRTGDPVFGYDDMSVVRPHLQGLSKRGLDGDLDASVGYLEDAGHELDGIATVGFCMGGAIALYAATREPLGAAVTFYGGGVAEGRFGLPALIEQAPRLQAPWLGLYGDADAGIPVEQVEALRAAARSAAVETEIVRYPQAGHGFHCDARGSYHEPSARDAWARALDWLGRHLGG